jgi:hypothetical protein
MGLLTSASISKLLKDAMRRHATQALLAGARRAAKRGSKPITLEAIQAEVNAARRSRKADKRAWALVLDTNVLVSAFLCGGIPDRLIELAGEKEIDL